jgi:hypothetical protein
VILYPQKDKAHWIMEVTNLWDKISWWAKFSKNFLKKAGPKPWMEEGT